MKRVASILLLFGFLTGGATMAHCATPLQMEMDAEVDRLCAIDGGLKIYETVSLPPEKFEAYKARIESQYPPKEKSLGHEYLWMEEIKYLHPGGDPRADLLMSRSHIRVFRRSDEKLLGELIAYTRAGEEIDREQNSRRPPAHYLKHNCPNNALDLFKKVFSKTEREKESVKEFLRLVHLENSERPPEKRFTEEMIDKMPKTPEELLTRLKILTADPNIGGVEYVEKLTGIGRAVWWSRYFDKEDNKPELGKEISYASYGIPSQVHRHGVEPIQVALTFSSTEETPDFYSGVDFYKNMSPKRYPRITPEMTEKFFGRPSEVKTSFGYCSADESNCTYDYLLTYHYDLGHGTLTFYYSEADIKGIKGSRRRKLVPFQEYELYKNSPNNRISYKKN